MDMWKKIFQCHFGKILTAYLQQSKMGPVESPNMADRGDMDMGHSNQFMNCDNFGTLKLICS